MEQEGIKTAAETWKALKLEEKAVNKHGKASGGRSLWHSHTCHHRCDLRDPKVRPYTEERLAVMFQV